MNFRFVHAADLHLDSPFSGIRRDLPPAIRDMAVTASMDALDTLVQICIEEEVSFLLLAGDIFDHRTPSLRAQVRLGDAAKRLSGAGIPVVRVAGNHDPLNTARAHLDEPDGAHLFSDDLGTVTIPVPGGSAEIRGVSHPHETYSDDPLHLFPRLKSQPGIFRVGLLHTDVDGSAGDGYAPSRLHDLISSGDDYWALGHVHSAKLLRESEPTIAYSGTTQGRHFGETGPKGCYLVEVRDGIPRPAFRPLDSIRWAQPRLPLDRSIDTEAEILDLVSNILERIADEAGGRAVLIRLIFEGESPLATSFESPAETEDLLETVRELASSSPTTWIDSISWRVARPMDRSNLRDRDDLLGDIARVETDLLEELDSPDSHIAGEFLEQLDSRIISDPRLRKWIKPGIPRSHAVGILERARESLLRTISKEESP